MRRIEPLSATPRASMRLRISAWSGTAAVAAQVGVEARTSATMSAMKLSGSCPMPVTTGIGQAAMARARPSSLNGIMVS